MDKQIQIDIFKQVALRWLNNQTADLLGDGIGGKLLRPIVDTMIENFAQNPAVDAFLGVFVDKEGKLNIDDLLDKYIGILAQEDGIRFKWEDIAPAGALLDRMNGGKVNVITADDIRELKNALVAALQQAV